jgi:hypothetical protein
MSELFDFIQDTFMPKNYGRCIYCRKITDETNVIADDVDEEGHPTGSREFAHNECCEHSFDKI